MPLLSDQSGASDSDDPSPEALLAQHVPETFDEACEPLSTSSVFATSLSHVSAAIECSAGDAVLVSYTQFPNNYGMDQTYRERLASVADTEWCDAPRPFNDNQYSGGKILCYMKYDGAHLVWTNERLWIYSEAVSEDGDSDALYEYFENEELGLCRLTGGVE